MAEQKVPMPKVVNVPKPGQEAYNLPKPGPEAFAPRGHNSFLTAAMHEDVGRVMQNIIDLQQEVAALRKTNMEWERRALLAEGKVEQMKQEFADAKDDFNKDIVILKGQHGDEVARVQRELDYFKSRDSVVQTKLHIGAQHFLDCITAIDKDRKDQETKILSGMSAELSKLIDEADKNEPAPT